MSIKLYLAVGLLVLALLGGAWGYAERQGRKRAETQLESAQARLAAQAKSLKAANTARRDLDRRLQASREAHKAKDQALEEALQGPAEAWGATQVPPEVRDAL